MKKLLCVFLLLSLLFSLSSCGDRKYDAGEVKNAAEILIKKTRTLNDVYWGAGIGYYEDDNYADGSFFPADPTHLAELGFETVSELREKTEKVFSKRYCEVIFENAFVTEDDGDSAFIKRYYQGIDCIMVNSKSTVFLSDKVTYLFDTLEVSHSEGELVFVSLDVRVERDGKTQERTINVGLIEEDDGWRIDTPTYVSYRQE